MSDRPERIVPVVIHGQRYPIKSSLDEPYIAELAVYVNQKMRTAAEDAPTGDALRLAVIAALNIADEVFRCRDTERSLQASLNDQAQRIEQLLDRALAS